MIVPIKEYIGDGIYCTFDGYSFILTTENGISTTNTIVMESRELETLNEFVDRIRNSD